MVLLNSCAINRKSTVSGGENLRDQLDIRIYAIYMLNGDTITIDHNSKIITRISDYEIKFIDRVGNVHSFPMIEISGFLIREENKPATAALRFTGLVLSVVAVAVAVGLII